MTMKKGTLLMVVAMLVLAILVTGCAPNTPAAETKVLVVGLDDTFAPMGFRNEKNEIVGFDVDLALEVATRNGWGSNQ